MNTEPTGWAPRRGLLLCLAWGVVSCAGAQQVRRGDRLLAQGRLDAAIAAYEEALREAPEHAGAREGIRRARRRAVEQPLKQAEQLLAAGDFPAALEAALRARRMPLDLEAVELVQRIDETIALAASKARSQVEAWQRRGLFLPAVELARRVVRAAPDSVARGSWAREVEQAAREHYLGAAERRDGEGLFAGAALQLAMAQQVGAEVDPTRLTDLWRRFAESTCFSGADVRLTRDEQRSDSELERRYDPMLRRAIDEELARLLQRCGVGTRSLSLVVRLAGVDVVDETTTRSAFEPVPGASVATTEEYYEDVPYTAVERVTEYEVRLEDRERRDCAPRPGKERKCRTWTEKVEVRVPVTREVAVRRLRRVKKTRPAAGPFDPEEVVSYPLTSIKRGVRFRGRLALQGVTAVPVEREFEVSETSTDEGHSAVSERGVELAEDPLEARTVADLAAAAAARVGIRCREVLLEALGASAVELVQQAELFVRQGQLPQAEEVYLKLLALGLDDIPGAQQLFEARYGRGPGQVVRQLTAARQRARGAARPADAPGLDETPSEEASGGASEASGAPGNAGGSDGPHAEGLEPGVPSEPGSSPQGGNPR